MKFFFKNACYIKKYYYICSVNQLKQNKMENFKNLDELLNSEEFNTFFNVEEEEKELKKEGWTLKEVREFAESINKKK